MTLERKEIVVTIICGIVDIVFKIIAIFSHENIFFVISVIISLLLIVIIFLLRSKYQYLLNQYEFVKYLFFGSEYNVFNFFPKLKLYMDYLGNRNQVDIETIEFECVSDNIKNRSDVKWTMKNVYNNTEEEIKSYYLYTTSELGTTKNVKVDVKAATQTLDIDTDMIKRKNGVQCTPFTFIDSIKPKGRIAEIKICMEMYNAFDFSSQEIVYLYPRNYGSKVKNIDIVFRTIGTDSLSVQLHEVKKKKEKYIDEPIKSCAKEISEKIISYSTTLQKEEINVENLYYLLIRPLETEE